METGQSWLTTGIPAKTTKLECKVNSQMLGKGQPPMNINSDYKTCHGKNYYLERRSTHSANRKMCKQALDTELSLEIK